MRVSRLVAAGVGTAALFFVFLIGSIKYLGTPEQVRHTIEEYFHQTWGFPVSLDAHIAIKGGLTPRITLTEARVHGQNVSWLTAEKIVVDLSLAHLFLHELKIRRLTLEDGFLVMPGDEAERLNLPFSPPTPMQPDLYQALESVTAKNFFISWRLPADKTHLHELFLSAFSAQSPGNNLPLHVIGSGKKAHENFTFSGVIPSPQAIGQSFAEGRELPFVMGVRYAGAHADLRGALHPTKAHGMAMKARFVARSANSALPSAMQALFLPQGETLASGRFERTQQRLQFPFLDLKSRDRLGNYLSFRGQLDSEVPYGIASGRVLISFRNTQTDITPVFKGLGPLQTLEASALFRQQGGSSITGRLDGEVFSASLDTSTTASAKGSIHLSSFDLEKWITYAQERITSYPEFAWNKRLELAVTIDTLIYGQNSMQNLDFRVTHDENTLTIPPLTVQAGQGSVSAGLVWDRTTGASFSLQGQNIVFDRVLPGAGLPVRSNGSLWVQAQSDPALIHDLGIVNSVRGNGWVLLENGVLPHQGIWSDIFTTEMPFSCLAVHTRIEGLTLQNIALASAHENQLLLAGQGAFILDAAASALEAQMIVPPADKKGTPAVFEITGFENAKAAVPFRIHEIKGAPVAAPRLPAARDGAVEISSCIRAVARKMPVASIPQVFQKKNTPASSSPAVGKGGKKRVRPKTK